MNSAQPPIEVAPKQSNEQAYYDALHLIAKKYMTPDQIRRDAKREPNGPDYGEYLEMSYQNIQAFAANIIKGKRRPAK